MATRKTKTINPSELSERVMLVKKTVRRWRAYKNDRALAVEMAAKKNASSKMVGAGKNLIDPKAMSDITKAYNEGDWLHKCRTLPWKDGGIRMLSSESYFKYMEEQNAAKEKFFAAVDDFCGNFQEHFTAGGQLLGDLFNNELYPKSAEELKQKFTYSVNVYPLPRGNDFRISSLNGDLDRVRKEIEEDQREVIAEAMKEPYQRLAEYVKRMVERLNGYSVDSEGKVSGKFHDTVVTNLKDVVDLIPELNIIGDKQLAAVADQIQKSLIVKPHDLRGDEKFRHKTATEAEKILKKLESFV